LSKNQGKVKILVLDDDDSGRNSLAEILRVNGYTTFEAATGKEAIEKIRSDKIDVALLDIKLPDMPGTQVLSIIKIISPQTINIMITGFPSLENASNSLNTGAQSYFIKPFNIEAVLSTISKKIQEREISVERNITEFAKQRLLQAQLSDYEKFSENLSNKLVAFGLNKTQAKVFLATNILGSALASEIAELSGVRREEVYRTIPILKRKGLMVSNFNVHNRFSATNPKLAINSLTRTRIKDLKKEAAEIRNSEKEILNTLEKVFFQIGSEQTIEPVYEIEYMKEKLFRAVEKAQKFISIAMPPDDFSLELLTSIFSEVISLKMHLKFKILICLGSIDKEDADLGTYESLKSFAKQLQMEIRQVDYLPFKLVLIDSEQAMWGDFSCEETSKVFWTNDSMQLYILEVAFNQLWLQSKSRSTF
jgi:DNA-binding response OmpR family regulator